jgi:predicted RNase H-like HicB family nuclease
VKNISPVQLVVRCFVERTRDGQWQAFSLELGLAAQGDSESEVRQKLESIIESYVRDALIGEDREHAYDLLSRRAPIAGYLKYYLHRIEGALARPRAHPDHSQTYYEPFSLEPRHCAA